MKGREISKTVTLRLDDRMHKKLRTLAERAHRTFSNFIEPATLPYIEQSQFMDEFEMDELLKNDELAKSLKKTHRGMKGQKGRFVE
jgi:predicted transcriptional regulator